MHTDDVRRVIIHPEIDMEGLGRPIPARLWTGCCGWVTMPCDYIEYDGDAS